MPSHDLREQGLESCLDALSDDGELAVDVLEDRPSLMEPARGVGDRDDERVRHLEARVLGVHRRRAPR